MQGRLSVPLGSQLQSFPWDTWEREFDLAAQADLQLVEWIIEADRFHDNPLLTNVGRARLRQLEAATGTMVRTACADCFMSWPLTTSDADTARDRLKLLGQILEASAELGIAIVTLPFVDASAIRNNAERDAAVTILSEAAATADACNVNLACEMSLPPEGFASFLAELDHPRIWVTYDSGNSASLGYDVGEEMSAYGSRVVSVHVKDRIRDGGTVPLGDGDADFGQLFESLNVSRYTGPLILQAARCGDEVSTIKGYVRFIRQHLAVATRGLSSS